jgi:hypothetical protein
MGMEYQNPGNQSPVVNIRQVGEERFVLEPVDKKIKRMFFEELDSEVENLDPPGAMSQRARWRNVTLVLNGECHAKSTDEIQQALLRVTIRCYAEPD